MKLLVREPGRLVFQLSAKDRNAIRALLRRGAETGRQPPRITRGPSAFVPQDALELLQAEQAARQQEFHSTVIDWLEQPARCVPGKGGFGLTLSEAEAETLLQALNSVKIGFWEALGSPDFEKGDPLEPTAENISLFLAIERASHYVACIVLALQGDEPTA